MGRFGCYGSTLMPEEPEHQDTQIHVDPDMRGGVWANFAVVKHSPHEFTIDFCRLEFETNPLYGVMVQRVNMSPLFANQLIRALSDNLTMYARSTPDGMTIDGGTDE